MTNQIILYVGSYSRENGFTHPVLYRVYQRTVFVIRRSITVGMNCPWKRLARNLYVLVRSFCTFLARRGAAFFPFHARTTTIHTSDLRTHTSTINKQEKASTLLNIKKYQSKHYNHTLSTASSPAACPVPWKQRISYNVFHMLIAHF